MSGVHGVAIYGVRTGFGVRQLVSLDEDCKECKDLKGLGISCIVQGRITRR